MTLYRDTSLLVSALANEPLTSAVLDWIDANQERGFATSRWALTEFSSALALKLRTNQLTLDRYEAATQGFKSLIDAFDLLSVEAADFDFAAHIAGRPSVALRSGDALHLAVAMRVGLPIRTLDRKFVLGSEPIRLAAGRSR